MGLKQRSGYTHISREDNLIVYNTYFYNVEGRS